LSRLITASTNNADLNTQIHMMAHLIIYTGDQEPLCMYINMYIHIYNYIHMLVYIENLPLPYGVNAPPPLSPYPAGGGGPGEYCPCPC
jgi:hypothetical protein